MYKSIVEESKKQFLFYQEKENKRKRAKIKSKPALWPSSLLGCKRKTAHQLLGTETSIDFNYTSLNYMDGGVVAENSTARSLKFVHNAKQNVRLRNEFWSGKADFIINFGQDNPIIIEHKATGEKYFNSGTKLPKREHASQLALYGYLYEQLYDVKPELILYYDSWGHFADFTLDVQTTRIGITGLIDNVFISRNLRIDIQKEISDLEQVYKDTMAGKPLPDRLTNKNAGCTFMGRPSCQFYHSCWDK